MKKVNNFDVNNFVIGKNYAIEASAGTGKTYNVIEIVKKLVKGDDTHLALDLKQILIVTYTEKAAGELKNRVRNELPGFDVDSAPIHTFHSFCKSVIDEYGISMKKPLNLSLVEDIDLYKFLDRYVREGEVLKTIVYFIHGYGADVNVENIKNILVSAIKDYYLDSKGQEDPSIISINGNNNFEEEYKFIKKVKEVNSIDELFIGFPELKKNFETIKNSSWPSKDNFIAEISENFKNGWNFDGNKCKKAISEPDVQEAVDYFKSLRTKYKKFKVDLFIARLHLNDAYIKWQEEKEKNKSQSFDDMIRTVREEINSGGILLDKLRKKYVYAIIDEFQDTNQKQYDIFFNIFNKNDDHHIIVVGDPKQSIYSFQGANIEVYRNAISGVDKNKWEVCSLAKNFRSNGDLVSSLNKLFKKYNFFDWSTFTDSAWVTDKDKFGTFRRFTYSGKKEPAIWVAVKNEGEKELQEYEYAKTAVKTILDCCEMDENGRTKLQLFKKNNVRSEPEESRNVSFKDFVVLARTKTEMIPIENALKKAGIPFIRYKDTRLFSSRECKHWITLLEAVNTVDFTGNNRRLFRKALFTVFFGKSLREISDDKYSKDDSFEAELFKKWRELIREKLYEDLFDSVIVDSGVMDRLNNLGKIQSLTIVKQIADYCIEYLSRGNTLDDLIRHLNDLYNGESSASDEDGAIIEKSTNFDCVRIMTMHASKGLQFPVVISVGGFKGPYNQVSTFTYTKNGKRVLDFESSKDYDACEEAEWKRLYYVGYTRAEFLMILPIYRHVRGNKEFIKDTLLEAMSENPSEYKLLPFTKVNYDDLTLKSRKILSYIKNTESIDTFTKDEQDEEIKKLIKNRKNKVTFKNSYSSLSHGDHKEDEELIIDDEIIQDKEGAKEEGLSAFDTKAKMILGDYLHEFEQINFPIDYPKGPNLGNALHEIFEIIDYTDYESYIDDVIINCFKKQGFKMHDDWLRITKDMVNHVLSAKIVEIHDNDKTGGYFSLNEIKPENKKTEMEFNFNLLNDRLRNYCNGFIDLTFRRGSYYSILDWKSDRINDTDLLSFKDPNDLKKHVDNCYSIQRVLYSYCLIKWLKTFYPSKSEEQIFNDHFGGIYYVFLRGCNSKTSYGVYSQTWESFKDLQDSFDQIVKEKVK